MKLGIINSAFGQAGVDTKTGLEHIARIGFDAVDIFTEAMSIDEVEISTIKDTCATNNLPITSTVVVSAGLIDFNDPVRDYHVERSKKFVDLAQDFESKNLLLVLGEYIWQREVIPPEAQWEWGVEGVRKIGEYAGERGLEIALELEPFRLSLLNSIPEMARFIDDCAMPNVKANIDVSHLVLADTSPAEIEKLRGKATHVHISDCDGKVHGDLPPGRGVVKFAPYLQAIKELDFEGTVSIELEYSPDPSKIVEWVEEAYNATNDLMQQVGLRDIS
ncbi:MAG: sugar phosphate isomerase/epimerase [Verrucomicrobiaceae bacterium]|nr:sugar phosphate isomerase/epimerase [Verrucomicrobiaceae bacterium]